MKRRRAYTEPPPWRRSSPAGERTRSTRWRAGARRTKRLRNVPARDRDYPRGWIRFYHCDGTFSHAIKGSQCIEIPCPPWSS